MTPEVRILLYKIAAYMESLNQTIKKTLHFISVIQDACDKRRLHVERINFQGYDAFVKEWKIEKSAKLPKKSDIILVETLHDEGKTEGTAIIEEDMEELALVDSLLEKARNIRLKNKNLSKKGEAKQTPNTIEAPNNSSKSSLVDSQRLKPCLKRNDSLNKRPVPRSKSAGISSKLKTSVVPRSKSANVQHIMNGDENGQRLYRTSTKPTSRNGRTIVPSDNTVYSASKISVLSHSELDQFKNLGSSKNFRKKKSPFCVQSGEKGTITSNSDLKQYPENQTLFPTYRKFLKESQRISVSKSSFRKQICGVWYPFLSMKNKKYLLDQPNIVPLDGLTKALKLIHQIQETMLWIDLLSMIARDALPNLDLLDKTDWNAIRLCSFLESIYSENLQRTPIVDTS